MSRKREIRRCARSAEVETASSLEIRNFSFLCGTAFGELSTSRCSSLTHKAERFTLVQQQRGWRLGETAPYGNALKQKRREECYPPDKRQPKVTRRKFHDIFSVNCIGYRKLSYSKKEEAEEYISNTNKEEYSRICMLFIRNVSFQAKQTDRT